MKEFLKKNNKIIITIAIGILLSIVFLFVQNVFSAEKTRDILVCIINSFFVTGVILTCFGLLVFVNNEGMFNIFVYGIKMAFSVMRFNKEKRKMNETYQEYCARRKKNPFGYLVIVGLCFMILSFFLYIFV